MTPQAAGWGTPSVRTTQRLITSLRKSPSLLSYARERESDHGILTKFMAGRSDAVGTNPDNETLPA